MPPVTAPWPCVYLFLTPCKNTTAAQSSLKERGQEASGLNYLRASALTTKMIFFPLEAKLVPHTGSN